jgi:hypothetical protein
MIFIDQAEALRLADALNEATAAGLHVTLASMETEDGEDLIWSAWAGTVELYDWLAEDIEGESPSEAVQLALKEARRMLPKARPFPPSLQSQKRTQMAA